MPCYVLHYYRHLNIRTGERIGCILLIARLHICNTRYLLWLVCQANASHSILPSDTYLSHFILFCERFCQRISQAARDSRKIQMDAQFGMRETKQS